MHPDPIEPIDENLSKAIDALVEGKKMPELDPSPELKMAIQMKTALNPAQLSAKTDAKVEAMLLDRFAKKAPQKEPSSGFRRFIPYVFGGLSLGFASVVLAIFVFHWGSPQPTQTLAEAQDFEPLSEAEVILGELPEDAVSSDGIVIADLRSEIHEINVLIQSADTTVDPNASIFPHVELRGVALDWIELEAALISDLPEDRVASLGMDTEVETFNEKVQGWPTTNEGVDLETHSKAVDSFLAHANEWKGNTLELAEELSSELLPNSAEK